MEGVMDYVMEGIDKGAQGLMTTGLVHILYSLRLSRLTSALL